MILGIVVEGETEEAFVNQLLDPHLRVAGMDTNTFVLRGRVSVARIASTMANLFSRCDAVTSLVDYYGFGDKGPDNVDALQDRILNEVKDRLDPSTDLTKVIPYVQKHEFEAILFAQVSAFQSALGLSSITLSQLSAVSQQFPNPEDINDNPETAPSKRIEAIIDYYNKVTYGPMIARAIGLPTIRTKCPRFHSWVTSLESLSA